MFFINELLVIHNHFQWCNFKNELAVPYSQLKLEHCWKCEKVVISVLVGWTGHMSGLVISSLSCLPFVPICGSYVYAPRLVSWFYFIFMAYFIQHRRQAKFQSLGHFLQVFCLFFVDDNEIDIFTVSRFQK